MKWKILTILIPILFPMMTKAMTNEQVIAQKIAYYAWQSDVNEDLAVKIASCESGFAQVSGKINPDDYGVMQISRKFNGALAKKLGFDIFNIDDNIRFGIYLIRTQGLSAYSASRSCWAPPPIVAFAGG